MIQMFVLILNVALAQDSLSFLLENKRDMNLLSNGLNPPAKAVESSYVFTKPSALVDVVRSKDPGGYFLKIERGTTGVSDIVEVHRTAPKQFATKKVTLDSFQKVTAITDCDGGIGTGGILSALVCMTVNRDYCRQIANDKSIGNLESLQEQIKQCSTLTGKFKRIVEIHSNQMKGGPLSKQYTADTDKLRAAFGEVTTVDVLMDVFPRNSVFKTTNNPGPIAAAKILELCQLQKTSEGPVWASGSGSNSLKNGGNAHTPGGTN